MKVCSLYGAGFFYIPGTDTCLKIGGFVRAEWNHNATGSFTTHVTGSQAQYNRSTDTLTSRSRGLLSFDVRSQTEYGTLRSFIRAGWTSTAGANGTTAGCTGPNTQCNNIYFDRAFIQFAGFTFGKTQSFFDVPDIADMTYQTEYVRTNTGGDGHELIAYTAMLGNGVTATLSIEDSVYRRNAVVDLNGAASFAVGAANTTDSHGNETPDIIGNLRVDQAWGSAQVSGALHLNQGAYYGVPAAPAGQQGHPDDKWGWAVGAGLLLKMPWDAKDTFAVSAAYGEGATRFVWKGTSAGLVQTGGVAVGWVDDSYFRTGGQLELATAWNITAGFQHYWTNSLRSSIWGSYAEYEAGSAAVNALICTPRGFGAGCADWSAYQIGSRTIWNPVTNLDIGLEVMYSKIDTAFSGAVTGAAAGVNTLATTNVVDPTKRVSDQDVWSGILRIQRNFWP